MVSLGVGVAGRSPCLHARRGHLFHSLRLNLRIGRPSPRARNMGRSGCVHTSGAWVVQVADTTAQSVVSFPLLCYHMVLNCKQPALVACRPP